MATAYIGIDVGTGSVRAALVSDIGQVLHTSVMPIKIHNPQQDFYEQSSTNIWVPIIYFFDGRSQTRHKQSFFI